MQFLTDWLPSILFGLVGLAIFIPLLCWAIKAGRTKYIRNEIDDGD